VILVDANLLLYARLSSFDQHVAAHRWLDDRLNGRASVGLAWPSLLAFVRICANPRIFPHPLSVDQAWLQVREWLALPSTWCPGPTELHEQCLAGLIEGQNLSPKLVMDAHLAALAIEHGLILCSADRDFQRFEGLRCEDPISG